MQKGTALYDMLKNGRAAKAAVLTQRSDQVLVRAVQPSIQTAGGVNLPKILKCEGSDGCVYKQLVKGKDDTRQDAVMQQAFELVNVLLYEVDSRQHALRLRTYRVVPLAQTAGVLQWVEDTIPLTHYLVGATRAVGAHGRFRPGDLSTQAARAKMKEVQERQPLAKAAQLEAYTHITEHLKPVPLRGERGPGMEWHGGAVTPRARPVGAASLLFRALGASFHVVRSPARLLSLAWIEHYRRLPSGAG